MHPNMLLIQNNPAHRGAVLDTMLDSGDESFRVEWVSRCCDGLARVIRRRRQENSQPDGVAAILAELILSDTLQIEAFTRLFREASRAPIVILSASLLWRYGTTHAGLSF
jgi:hypothetical protein